MREPAGMRKPSRSVLVLRRVASWSLAWILAAALYLLLIDITDLPELIVGAAAAVLAATGFELARERQAAGGLMARVRWLRRLYRPLLQAPSDLAVVSALAFRQLVRPRDVNGQCHAVEFHGGEHEPLESGRRALAESFGSFAPNTIIVGVDPDRELILGHQLHRAGGEAIDILGLG